MRRDVRVARAWRTDRGHSEGGALCKAGGEASGEPEPASALTVDFEPPEQ